MNTADKLAYARWQEYLRSSRKQGVINYLESDDQRNARVKYLSKDFFAWAQYHFPEVVRSPFAPWHKRFVNHVVQHDECYCSIKVCRDFAKSSVTAMLMVYLHLEKKVKVFALFSKNETKAVELLKPVKRAFEFKESLRRDYGNIIGNTYSDGLFETTLGGTFAAFGSGQSPRGIKSEDSLRLECAVFDDFDDDEVCRNPERLENAWQYCLGQVYPAFHVSGSKRIIHLNNRIAEDCIIQRAFEHAPGQVNPLAVTVNLTDNEGRSNWPDAYTDEQCRAMINLTGDYARTEYFNEPRKKGTVWKPDWILWKKMPPLNRYKMLVAYLDGGFKKGKTADTKALVLVGLHEGQIHIRRAYVDNCSIEDMIAWHYDLHQFLQEKQSTAIWWMEEVFLLSLLHDHFDAAVPRYGFRIPMQGDTRKKPDKDLRIQNTAGYFERSNIFFDEAMRDDRGMKRLVKQYLDYIPGSRGHEKDGPDAVEGAIHKLQEMIGINPDRITIGRRAGNKHRA